MNPPARLVLPSPVPIEGVRTKVLRPIPDERGRLMELLRADDDLFRGFAHAYVTTALPGVVKAWHVHRHQTDTMAAIHGMVKLVLYDHREGSSTRGRVNEFFMGIHAPLLVQVPAGVLHGFKCISEHEALVVNFPDRPYDADHPDEFRLPPDDPSVPYDWARRDG